MKGLTLVLADYDTDCIEALSDYFSFYYKKEFLKVVGFDNVEQLSDYLEHNRVDILLCGVEMNKLLKEKFSIKMKIFFKSNTVDPQLEDAFFVDPSEPANQICEEILKFYAVKNPSEKISAHHLENTKLIVVFSPIGGVGKTTVSIGLSKALSDESMSTLYLNFGVSPFCENSSLNLTDLICEAVKEQGNIANIGYAAQMKDESGFYYFNSPTSMTDAEDMTPDQALGLINALRNSGNYQRIVLDLPSEFNKENRNLISNANQVILVSNNQKDSSRRIQNFEKNLNLLDGKVVDKESFLRKTIYVINENHFTKESTSSDQLFAGQNPSMILPFDSKIASTGYTVHDYKFAEAMKSFVQKNQI